MSIIIFFFCCCCWNANGKVASFDYSWKKYYYYFFFKNCCCCCECEVKFYRAVPVAWGGWRVAGAYKAGGGGRGGKNKTRTPRATSPPCLFVGYFNQGEGRAKLRVAAGCRNPWGRHCAFAAFDCRVSFNGLRCCLAWLIERESLWIDFYWQAGGGGGGGGGEERTVRSTRKCAQKQTWPTA